MFSFLKLFRKNLILILSLIFLFACGDPLAGLPGGSRETPSDGRERARKNLEEGKGISIGKALGGGKTTYEFSSSNPMWRATFDVIDFMPLVTVDYSGGMIITDWYTDANTTDESLKFTIRFLSNEVRADSLKIIIHKKSCNTKGENCIVQKISSPNLEQTIRADIIRKAARLVEDAKKKKKK
tara:strand:- start:298 stop:846 length:549 start_codon:yes stop_codon:yes gene_type:complete